MANFLRVDDSEIALDQEGYLVDLQDWGPQVATQLALQEQIRLGPSHWEVLNLLRRFYSRQRMSGSLLVKSAWTQAGRTKSVCSR